jgi:deoxyribonuclease-1
MKGPAQHLNVEHVYAASWMGAALGCGTRKQCQQTDERFNRMEADLHNLYPALEEINKARGNFRFTIIPGEHHAPRPTCDFEVDKQKKIAEPRPIARGNVARSIFYMHAEYGLPVHPSMIPLLKQWHQGDPPSEHEKRRNDRIEQLQGTRNTFIDQPELVEDLPM